MSEISLNTAVAFIIFKRPEETQRVFAEIRKVKPPKLLVVADGPRPHRPGEDLQCAAARAIIDQVDWECEIFRNYADTNLGCRDRVERDPRMASFRYRFLPYQTSNDTLAYIAAVMLQKWFNFKSQMTADSVNSDVEDY